MQVRVKEGAVPFVITYRKVLRAPKIERSRVFVGPVQLAKNIALRAIEFFETIAYETETKVLDPGQATAVHWAVDIPDPWEDGGRELSAYRMLDDMPPCGMHFEVISPPPQIAQHQQEIVPEPTQEKPVMAPPTPPLAQAPVRDQAYAPRAVKPLIGEDIDPLDVYLEELEEADD